MPATFTSPSWGSGAKPQHRAAPEQLAIAPAPTIVVTPTPPPIVGRPVVTPPSPAIAPPVSAPPVIAPVPVPGSPSKWAAFDKLGLDKIEPKKLSKYVVTMYRLLGFLILTIIVIVLIGYITTTAFFYMSDSWIVPAAVSPTDDKVMALQTQLAERQNHRDQTASELEQAEHTIIVQEAFQRELTRGIKSDLEARRAAFERMHALANAAASTRVQIRRSNTAYASESQRRMSQEFAAGLIDRNAMLVGKFQLAQISSSNLSLVERQSEYETRAADLEAQTRSLEALLADKPSGDAMTYDVLKIKQEYELSKLETDKAIENRDTLKTSLAREDKLLATLVQSSYLRAMTDHAQVAFVPYDNLHVVKKGSKLFGCKLGMVFCHQVGTVLEILPGEVQFKHPHRDRMLRGQMVELQLEDGADATDEVLFVGGAPLLF